MPARLRAVAAVAIAVVIASSACADERAIFATPASSPAATGPSQSRADARRDGVPMEVAAIPFDARLSLEPHGAEDDWVQQVIVGGDTWTITRPGVEYGEIVLVDHLHRRILKAYPLPGVPPQRLLATNDGIFCGRRGDGGIPDSMVCRIDRKTREMIVHVFWRSRVPYPGPSPAGWTISGEELEMYAFEVDETGLWSKDYTGTWTRLDPVTLEVVARKVVREAPTPS